jgi:ectoine hydroxylase-related dioxygenase (phytanoyl-CoA dioxygenase family)
VDSYCHVRFYTALLMLESLPTVLLSEAQKNQFIEQGFVKLSAVIPTEIITKLREAIESICIQKPYPLDLAITEMENKRQLVTGIEKLCNKADGIFLTLLGSPFLLSIAEAICGVDFFPIQEFAVIKYLGDNNPILWHQDVANRSISKTFMLGIYLDAANEENGALRIIPQSHRSKLPICELQKMPYDSIEMQAGDVLIHDLMLVHSSGILTTFPKRRVIYFEFMNSTLAVQEQIYPETMINNRIALLALALEVYQKTHPDSSHFDWQHPDKDAYILKNTLASVYESPSYIKPANYCFDTFIQ